MVHLNITFFAAKMASRIAKRRFIDSLRIHVKGGPGGMGYPKYGGIGGKGGDVYVEAVDDITLSKVISMYPTQRIMGASGGNSRTYRILGDLGKDHTISCPVGVTVLSEKGQVLGNLDKNGDRILVARGGRGGCSENQFSGQAGQGHSITLDLKLIADVGLVGFPNAGKSSLLKRLSRASPKVASYPFTTLSPQLGIMQYDDLRQISVADLPGLIEGAHLNFGLGHNFLKHIERTKLLLFVIDIAGFQLNPQTKHRSAIETLVLLNKELELYSEEILEKPAILAINKIDLVDSTEILNQLVEDIKNIKDTTRLWPNDCMPNKFVQFDDIIPIVAKTGQSTDTVGKRLRELIDYYDEEKRSCQLGIRNLNVLLGEKHDIRLL